MTNPPSNQNYLASLVNEPQDTEAVSFSRSSHPRGNTVIKLLAKASIMGDQCADEGVFRCSNRHSEGEVCLECALSRHRYPVTVLSLCSLILSLKDDLRWKSIHAEGYPEMGKTQLEGGFISDSVHVCNSLTGFNAIAHYAPWHKNNWIPTKFVSTQHGENLKEVTHWRVCPTVGT